MLQVSLIDATRRLGANSWYEYAAGVQEYEYQWTNSKAFPSLSPWLHYPKFPFETYSVLQWYYPVESKVGLIFERVDLDCVDLFVKFTASQVHVRTVLKKLSE